MTDNVLLNVLQIILNWVVINCIAGWLIGFMIKGDGYGIILNFLLGSIGSIIADLLLPQFNISFGFGVAGAILNAAVGAIFALPIVTIVTAGRE